MKTLRNAGGKPAYLRLYEQLRTEIVCGAYPLGARMPSKRTVAEEKDVSLVTVEHAYALLCDEGYVEARERSGFFVIFRAADGFAAAVPAPVPHAASFKNDSPASAFPFSVLAKTMRRVLSEYQERILIKSPNQGCDELRAAIAGYLARSRGIMVAPEQIVVGSGAEYLYSLVVRLLGRESIYALENPSYEKIERVYRAEGVQCDMLPMCGDGVESAALAGTCANVMHVTPYRSYPSGITASASKCHEYVRWAAQPGRFLVEDDFESEFTVSAKPEETLFSLSPNANVIYMNTFSRTISPSMRAGYMVLPERLLERYRSSAGFYSCTVPAFEQYVLAELISSGDFERHINRIRRQKRRSLARAVANESRQVSTEDLLKTKIPNAE